MYVCVCMCVCPHIQYRGSSQMLPHIPGDGINSIWKCPESSATIFSMYPFSFRFEFMKLIWIIQTVKVYFVVYFVFNVPYHLYLFPTLAPSVAVGLICCLVSHSAITLGYEVSCNHACKKLLWGQVWIADQLPCENYLAGANTPMSYPKTFKCLMNLKLNCLV